MSNLQGLSNTLQGFRNSLQGFTNIARAFIPFDLFVYEDHVYVGFRSETATGTENGKVVKYTTAGVKVKSWAVPNAIPITTVQVYNDEVYVQCRSRFYVYTLSGTLARTMDIDTGDFSSDYVNIASSDMCVQGSNLFLAMWGEGGSPSNYPLGLLKFDTNMNFVSLTEDTYDVSEDSLGLRLPLATDETDFFSVIGLSGSGVDWYGHKFDNACTSIFLTDTEVEPSEFGDIIFGASSIYRIGSPVSGTSNSGTGQTIVTFNTAGNFTDSNVLDTPVRRIHYYDGYIYGAADDRITKIDPSTGATALEWFV